MGALTDACCDQTLRHSSSLLTASVVGLVMPLAIPLSIVENDAPAAIAATAQRLTTEEGTNRKGRATAYWSRKLVEPLPDWYPDLVAVEVTVYLPVP